MGEIGVIWLRNGEIKGFIGKIGNRFGEMLNISPKSSKMIFSWKNKPLSSKLIRKLGKDKHFLKE